MGKIWWEQSENYFLEAMSYINPLKMRNSQDEIVSKFFEDYNKSTLTSFIFESNTIEREGLSEEDTKKIVFEGLNCYESIINTDSFENSFEDSFEDVLDVKAIKLKQLRSNVSHSVALIYKNKEKEYFQVSNQMIAILEADMRAINFCIWVNYRFKELIEIRAAIELAENQKTPHEQLEKIHKKLLELEAETRYLIDEDFIKKIHEYLAEDMDNNENGLPGEYRPNGAWVNFNTIFLEPSLIAPTMRKLIQDHQKRCNSERFNLILEACKVSADIVKIHPFGDFNGRTSRIILNTVLRSGRLPFYLVLRGNSRDKRKYITSMQQYFQKKRLKGYIALVCSSFLQQVNEINEKLKLAGIAPIEPEVYTEEKRKQLISELDYYTSTT